MVIFFQIPVFIGCSAPLLGEVKPRSTYHGSDGFGDVPDPGAPDDRHLQSQHAVEALIKLTKEHAGKYGYFSIKLLPYIPLVFGCLNKQCRPRSDAAKRGV